MSEQNFNVAKYSLDSCIINLESSISMIKQMSNSATSLEQLEQTKNYFETIIKNVETNLNKISIQQIERNHSK